MAVQTYTNVLLPTTSSDGIEERDYDAVATVAQTPRDAYSIPAILQIGNQRVEVPPPLVEALAVMAKTLAEGDAVTISVSTTVLTTQQAADFLGVSRQTVVRLCDAGKIPFAKINRHRRIQLADLLEYRIRARENTKEALTLLMSADYKAGLYDISRTDIDEALVAARKEIRSRGLQ